MPSLRLSLVLAAAFAGLESFASAPPVFADNFDNYPTSAFFPVSSTDTRLKWMSKQDLEGRSITVYFDDENHFGRGPTNCVLELKRGPQATRDLTLLSRPIASPLAAGHLTFRFFVAAGGIKGDGRAGFRVTLLANTTTDLGTVNTANTVTGFHITDGNINRRNHTTMLSGPLNETPFEPGQVNSLDFVFNNTNAPIPYVLSLSSAGSPERKVGSTVSPGHSELWINGEKRLVWPLGSGGAISTGAPVNALYFLVPAGLDNSLHVQGALRIDDLALSPLVRP